jgi:hypothetical protein
MDCYRLGLPGSEVGMPPLIKARSSSNSSTHSERSQVSVDRQSKKKTPPSITCSKTGSSDCKQVHFSKEVKVRNIISHRKYSKKERRDTWYSQEESKAIRAYLVTTVKKMMKGKDVDKDKDDCSRGLEFKTPTENKIRQRRKQMIIWTVLNEQEMLAMKGGEIDYEYVACIYRSANRQSVSEAMKRGVQDEIQALLEPEPDHQVKQGNRHWYSTNVGVR